jgi:hypothetical protein
MPSSTPSCPITRELAESRAGSGCLAPRRAARRSAPERTCCSPAPARLRWPPGVTNLTQPKVPAAKVRGSREGFQCVLVSLERVLGVRKGVPRGPVGPPGPLEFSALIGHRLHDLRRQARAHVRVVVAPAGLARLHTRITAIFGASTSETTMRPSPRAERRGGGAGARLAKCKVVSEHCPPTPGRGRARHYVPVFILSAPNHSCGRMYLCARSVEMGA